MNRKIVIRNGVAHLYEREDLNADHPDAEPDWQDVDKGERPFSLRLLGVKCEIEDTTFGQFWEWVFANPDLIETVGEIFGEDMGHFPIHWYVEQIKKDREERDLDGGMQYLEVYWHAEIFRYRFDPDRKPILDLEPSKEDFDTFEVSTGFHGYGIWEANENGGIPEGTEGGFAIEFTPLNNLKHYPLRLNTEIKLYEWGASIKGDGEIVKDKRNFTLYEVLQAILYEITWGGCPGREGGESQLMLDLKARTEEIAEKGIEGLRDDPNWEVHDA